MRLITTLRITVKLGHWAGIRQDPQVSYNPNPNPNPNPNLVLGYIFGTMGRGLTITLILVFSGSLNTYMLVIWGR